MADSFSGGSAWRRAFFLVLGLWIFTLLGGAYLILDQSVTGSYSEDSYRSDREDFAILMKLAPTLRLGASKADVLSTLRGQNPEALINATEQQVTTGHLVFAFDDTNRLVSVQHAHLIGEP
jgi:hypothetical protein